MGTGASVEIDSIWMEFVESKSQKLRHELITMYAPLVRFVVGRLGIPPTGLLEPEDLVSYGMIGLINAIDRFDPTRGVRFEAFASVRIRGAVIDQLRSLNWLPRSALSRMRQVEGALAVLEQKLGRPAREEEVASEIGVSIERYRQMLLEMNSTILSLDAPLGSLMQDDEVTSLSELLEDQSTPSPIVQAEQKEQTETLGAAIEQLPERERLLLALYYKEELTMKEISKVLSVSESRVCQLHMQAIMRLRSTMVFYRAGESGGMEESAKSLSGKRAGGESATKQGEDTGSGDSVSSSYSPKSSYDTTKSNAIAGSETRSKRKIS